MTIRELPFRKRDVHALLNFDDERATVDQSYAGYGWALVDEIYVDEQPVRDALVLAVHTADDAEALADDIVLEFELPERKPVSVLASAFLAAWLPQLPKASAIVLALCNPHRATLHAPVDAPLYYANGDVESWLDESDDDHRIRLASEYGWIRREPT